MTKPAARTAPKRRGSASCGPRAAQPPAPQPSSGPTGVRVSGTDGGNPLKRIGGSDSPRFNSVLLRQVLGTIWVPSNDPDDGAKQGLLAAVAALAAFKPQDEIEAMFAAQAVALHFGAMEALRRSMIPEQPSDVASRLRKDGANLSRVMVEIVEALDRRRGKGPRQVVRVERVVVQEGGQAIVGAVSAAGAPPTRAEGHDG